MAERDSLSSEQQRLLDQLLMDEGVDVAEPDAAPPEPRHEGLNFDPRAGVWGTADPLFFANPKRPLYGVHHPPRGGRTRRTGVVLCYPIALEYLRSHRAFVQLANLLTREGFHVLRFDYSSTGDSSGASDAGSVAQWRLDVAEAIRELGERGGVRSISLVGLRLGAALAAAAAARSPAPIRDLVLWDPVTEGKDYLERLGRLHRAMLRDPWRFSAPRAVDRDTHADEILGFGFPERLRREIESMVLGHPVIPAAQRIRIIVSEEHDSYVELHDRLKAAGADVVLHPCACDGRWDDPDRIEESLLPGALLQTIVRQLSESSE